MAMSTNKSKEHEDLIYCSDFLCDETVKDNSRHRATAREKGWFIRRNGQQAYCPEHWPEWAKEWMKKNLTAKKSPDKPRSPGWIYCDYPECEEAIKNHRWGKTKATGWFFQKNGKSYCPKHVPAWVKKWRWKRGY